MWNFRFLAVIFLIYGLVLESRSQSEDKPVNFCGMNSEVISAWLREYQTNPGAFAQFRNNNAHIQLPLTIHIIGRNDGSGYYSTSDLMTSLCYLNELFEPLNMSFFIKGPIRYHNNTVWFEHATMTVGNFMYNATRVPNTINCYIDSNAAGNCGYAGGFGSDRMYLRQSCIRGRNNTWAHEMGHALILPHTFYGWEGQSLNYTPGQNAPNVVNFLGLPVQTERVDRSNCNQAADGFCGTDPDYINIIWTCMSDRQSQLEQRDVNGATFRSQGKFIMSYSTCGDEFSEDQQNAMRAHTLSSKAAMIDNTEYPPLSSQKPVGIMPLQEQNVHHENIRIEWEPIANADSFIVEISRFLVFSNLQARVVTTNNFVVIPNLPANQNWFYRILPISKSDFCVSWSDAVRFRAVVSTSTFELEGNSMNMYPSLLEQGQHITLSGNLYTSMNTRFELINTEGKVFYREDRFLNSGPLNESIFLPSGLAPGFYILRATSGSSVSSLKLMIK